MDDRKISVLPGDDYLGEKRFLCLFRVFLKFWKVLDEPYSSKNAKVCSNVRSSRPEVLCKKVPQTCNVVKKENLAQLVSCEFCEVFINRAPPVATS